MLILMNQSFFLKNAFSEDTPDLPGTVSIEMKGILNPLSKVSIPSIPLKKPHFAPKDDHSLPDTVVMVSNPLRPVTDLNQLSEIEFKLNKALLSLTNPEWRIRDKVAGAAILGLTSLCLAYVPIAEGSYWTNEFWGVCADKDENCFRLEYMNPNSGRAVDQSISALKISLGIAYGVYIPARLSELIELYTPDSKSVQAIKNRRGCGSTILNGVGEVGVLAAAGSIGFITASAFYQDEITGGHSADFVLQRAIPLGIFLAAESISPFKRLHKKIFTSGDLLKENVVKRLHPYLQPYFPSLRVHFPRSEIIDSLQRAKTVLHQNDDVLRAFRASIKNRANKSMRHLTETPTLEGLQRFKQIIEISRQAKTPEMSSLRNYAPKIAALTAFGASMYVLYEIFWPDMAALYDNSSQASSPFYQTQLKNFEDSVPLPDNSTLIPFLNWCRGCIDGIIWTSRDINVTTGEGTGVGSFGYNCPGISYQIDDWGFNLPGDVQMNFDNCAGWYDYFLQKMRSAAGTNTTTLTYSESAKEFGKGMGGVYAAVGAGLSGYGIYAVSNRLGDLFVDNPLDPQPGQKNKWFNALNLLYSTTQAAARTAPYGMLAYLALKDMNPDVMWTIGLMALSGKTANFITYFQERYRTIPGVVQRGWNYAKGLWGWATGKPVTVTPYRIAERDEALKEIDRFINLIPEIDDPYIDELYKIREQILAAAT